MTVDDMKDIPESEYERDLVRHMVRQDFPTQDPLYKNISEIMPFTEEHLRTIRETAYRRGFCHGACAAIEGHGMNLGVLRDWMFRLLRWRCEDHKGTAVDPEWIARKAGLKDRNLSKAYEQIRRSYDHE